MFELFLFVYYRGYKNTSIDGSNSRWNGFIQLSAIIIIHSLTIMAVGEFVLGLNFFGFRHFLPEFGYGYLQNRIRTFVLIIPIWIIIVIYYFTKKKKISSTLEIFELEPKEIFLKRKRRNLWFLVMSYIILSLSLMLPLLKLK